MSLSYFFLRFWFPNWLPGRGSSKSLFCGFLSFGPSWGPNASRSSPESPQNHPRPPFLPIFDRFLIHFLCCLGNRVAPARHGLAGTVRFQMARNGFYWHGTARVRHGFFWHGTVLLRQGTARFDMARFRHGTVWHGLVLARYGLACFDPGTVWHGLVVARHGSARFELGTVRHGLTLTRHALKTV